MSLLGICGPGTPKIGWLSKDNSYFCFPYHTSSNWIKVNSCFIIVMDITSLLPYKHRLWFMNHWWLWCPMAWFITDSQQFHNRDSQQFYKPTDKTKNAVAYNGQCWEHYIPLKSTMKQINLSWMLLVKNRPQIKGCWGKELHGGILASTTSHAMSQYCILCVSWGG